MRSRYRTRGRVPKVDLTPLLDTVFLVIILLLCSFIHMRMVRAISVEHPVVLSGSSILHTQNVLVIEVREDGGIFFQGGEVPLESLSDRLTQCTPQGDACLISADRQARHGRVTQVLVAARSVFCEKPVYFEVAQGTSSVAPKGGTL